MSEAAEPSSSRTAISSAFKRARRKFPKNFGLTFKSEESYKTDKNEELPLNVNNVHDPPVNYKSFESSISNNIELALVDSLKQVEISDNVKTFCFCGQCEYCAHNSENVNRDDGPVLNAITYDNNYNHQLSLFNNMSDSMNAQSLQKISQTNYMFNNIHQNLSLNKKEESDPCNTNTIEVQETMSTKNDWNPRGKISVTDSELDIDKVSEIPRRFYEQRETPLQRKKHKYKKSSQSYVRHSCSQFKLIDNGCGDNTSSHSPDCLYYNPCSHCYHCHLHCCCHSCCCCFHCCLNWRDRSIKSVHSQEPSSYARKRSTTHHRTKRGRCISCKRRSSDSGTSSRLDTCSRDSGIFTSVNYENVDYHEDEISNLPANIVFNRDSLTILQEYAECTQQ